MKINPINTTLQISNCAANKNNFNHTTMTKENKVPKVSPSFKGNIVPSSIKKLLGACACFCAPVVFPNPVTLILAITTGPFLFIMAVAEYSSEKDEDYRNRNRGDL